MPFTVECGHSFCYDCLHTWFENKINCPTCRHNIENKPLLNLQLKEISKAITDIIIDTCVVESEKTKLVEHRDGCWKAYNFDVKHKRIFGDLFKTALTLIDNSDGVPRCGNCHWEAHGSVCLHCGTRFRVPQEDEYYDSPEGDAYNEDADEHYLHGSHDEYDSADSFVDTRSVSEINRDVRLDDDDDILSSDNEVQSTTYDDWNGFHGDNAASPIILSGVDDDDDDDDDDVQYYDSDDIRDALDEFHDAQLEQVGDDDDIRSHRHRVIHISDEED